MSTLTIQKQGPSAVLSGSIDENADLKPLQQMSGEVHVNFKGVQRINSCGVRDWVTAVGKMNANPLVYEECPIVVVKQLNAVPQFLGKAKVQSFFAPYFCEDCNEEEVKLIQTSQVKGGQPPEQKCGACGKPLKFDGIAKQYFSFIKS